MEYTCIRTETRGAVGLVVLDRPKVLNALNRTLIDELGDALAGFDADDAIGAMVVTGNEKAFAAGADISEMVDKSSMDMFTARHFEGWERIEKVRKPVIAAVAGYALGGGCELAMACDIIIAADNARFGQPEIQIALTTGIGGTSRLARIIGRTATAEMVLDGTPMTAQRIYELGGVNRVVPEGTSVEVALDWASRLADRPAQALATLKQILIDNDDLGLSEALTNEQRLFQTVVGTEEAIATMGDIQDRFDAGESIESVYGSPRP